MEAFSLFLNFSRQTDIETFTQLFSKFDGVCKRTGLRIVAQLYFGVRNIVHFEASFSLVFKIYEQRCFPDPLNIKLLISKLFTFLHSLSIYENLLILKSLQG